MRIPKLLTLLLIVGTASAASQVSPNIGLCTCAQIQYQNDCLAVIIPNANASLPVTTCTWTPNPNATENQPKGTCAKSTSTNTVIVIVKPTTATYCSNVSAVNCASTSGCALPDGKTCQPFTGCSAYLYTTNIWCQAVSTQCTTDGTQCTTKQPCSYYSSQLANCGLYSASTGTGTCKVSGSTCVDQACSDAPTALTTDAQCNSFLVGCVSSGAGCTAAHQSCASQTGNSTSCPTLLGLVTEGFCKYSGTGTACAARTCADAPATLTTNAQCIAYMPTCLYTNGKGCVASAQTCADLKFSLGCSNLINTSGVGCTNNTSSNPPTACREIICTDNTTATTDAACNSNGLKGCVTNGAGCVLPANFSCSLYTGTNAQCLQFIGAQGPCKGNADSATTSQACVPKTCSDAPLTTNTNKACAAVQTGCQTNGFGCVQNLQSCQSYTPTASNPCDKYYGLEGPCTLINGPNCSARTCAGASTTKISGVVTNTNSGCQAWFPYISSSLPGCVTDGTNCIPAATCTTLNQTACSGFSTCSFIKSCVSNTACTNYQTQSQCISNVGQFGRSCVWNNNGTCTPTPCPTSSSNTITDAACQGQGATATPGCYYQGQGQTCIDGIGTFCGQFIGDNSFLINKGCAALFNNQCASANPLISTPANCVPRTCANYYQTTAGSTSNTSCDTWLSGCLSNKYQGCVTSTDDCTKYFGTQTTCNTIFANGVQCFNAANAIASTPCVLKTAIMIVQTTANQVWNDSQCTAQLANTVSSQVGIASVGAAGVCVANNVACNTISGSLSTCNTVVGLTGGKCTKTAAFCYPKAIPTCSNLQGTSIAACQSQYYNCTWASNLNGGTKCTTLGACSSYNGSATNCNQLTDKNGLKCGSNSSGNAACISASFCTDYNTGASSSAISYCATLSDALGNTCTAITNNDAICTYSVTGNKFTLGYKSCQAGQIITNGKCITPTTFTCTGLTGPYFNAQSNPTNCASVSSTCTWIETTSGCIAVSTCTTYKFNNAPQNAILGNTYCQQYKGTLGICQYVGIAGTQTGLSCSEPTGCTSYTATKTGQTLLSSDICGQKQNASGKYCGVASDLSTCIDPVTCSSSPATNDINGAIGCQKKIDSTTNTPCSVGTSTCASGATTCTGYNAPSGVSAGQISLLCQSYFIPSGVKCGYISGQQTCSNRTCADYGVTQSNCNTYLSSCIWSAAGSCVPISSISTCSQYIGTTNAICQALFDNKGRQCYFVTGGTCSDYQCSSLSTAGGATHNGCQLLQLACTAASPLTGNKCQTIQSSCFKYNVLNANRADCAQMYDAAGIPCSVPTTIYLVSGPCTYSTTIPTTSITAANCNNPGWTFTPGGTPTCTGSSTIVSTCNGTSAVGSNFSDKLSYCQRLTSSQYGTPCFYSQYTISGVTSTNCVDSVLSGGSDQLVYTPNCPAANVSNTPAGGSPSIGTGSDADCAAFSSGCTATISAALPSYPATKCTEITCDMASSTLATSTLACSTFQNGCIWNGTNACILASSNTCGSLTGTVATCATFVVNNIPCYQAVPTAITAATATLCSPVTCLNAPTTITSNAGCESWYPSQYASGYDAKTKPGPNLNCVWTGTFGCTIPQTCALFIGNLSTCPGFIGTDGPCKAGTNTNCTPRLCSDAPNSLTTDEACAKFANKTQDCLTTGYGCASRASLKCTSIVNQTSCAASTIGGAGTQQCSWLSTCVSSVTSCSDSSLSTATLCTSTPIVGATCVWNSTTNTCQNINCSLQPATLTTHAACSAALPTCTTTGAGCITLGTCASYSSAGQSTCESANNQELIGTPQITKCIWANNACRIIQCSDNKTATTKDACNSNGLTACVTTGLGCITGIFSCQQLITASACLIDGSNNPCLWVNGSCQQYSSCTSVALTTYSACQQFATANGIASGCTTNGIYCIALNSCQNYTNSASCLVSNNKQTCGWLPPNSKSNRNAQCSIFGACTDAAGTTTADCQLYYPTCISNGVSCQLISNCASYTQYACNNNLGTDGACFWQAVSNTVSIAFCRTQQCSDVSPAYTAGSTTDPACAAFSAPIINQCTTNGTTCIPRSTCASYITQLGCVIGVDGSCFWVLPTGTDTVGKCRVKQCTDSIFTNSSDCMTSIISSPAKTQIVNGVSTSTSPTYLTCVSNGTNCIAKQTCSSYVNQAACQGGGTDGDCAFTPGTNIATPTIGTCALFSQCSAANADQIACNKVSDRCLWSSSTTGSTTITSCSPITCAQASSSGTCKPVPSLNYASYQICAPASATNSTCIPKDGSESPIATCFSGSLGQYTWNVVTGTCTQCQVTSTINNTNGTTTTSFGLIVTFVFGLLIN